MSAKRYTRVYFDGQIRIPTLPGQYLSSASTDEGHTITRITEGAQDDVRVTHPEWGDAVIEWAWASRGTYGFPAKDAKK